MSPALDLVKTFHYNYAAEMSPLVNDEVNGDTESIALAEINQGIKQVLRSCVKI